MDKHVRIVICVLVSLLGGIPAFAQAPATIRVEVHADGSPVPDAEVIINGRPAATVTIPPGRLNNPVSVDISQFVAPGANVAPISRTMC